MAHKALAELFTGITEHTPLGRVWVAVSAKGIVAVQIEGELGGFSQKLATRFGIPAIASEIQVLPVIRQIEAYLQGEQKSFDFPIHWELLSPFQRNVLQLVYAIPYGETRSYGQIAAQIGQPHAARAVGRANATNPLPLVIPCHRLVGSDGSLRGYGGGAGIQTKAWLLELEKRNH